MSIQEREEGAVESEETTFNLLREGKEGNSGNQATHRFEDHVLTGIYPKRYLFVLSCRANALLGRAADVLTPEKFTTY
eukprot:766408-Hanusia_phi.AAC.7